MRNQIIQNLAAGIALLSPLAIANAQQLPATTINGRAPIAATAPTSVPALVPYSGTAIDAKGQPIPGETAATFLIYKDQQGGEPLFTETQTIAFDQAGHYKVQLGAANPNGLPSDLFATGEARWLEVQIAGQQPEPRVLLASVPYALKAADAATLGGLPASAYALAGSTTVAASLNPATITPDASASTVTTTGGTANTVAKFSGKSTIVNSLLYDNGTNVGIGTTSPSAKLTVDGTMAIDGASTLNGTVTLPAQGTATAAKAYNSQAFKLYTSAYNSSSASVVPPRFQLMAEVTGNDTASPNATLNLLASPNANAPAETGFYINTNGTIHFASGQTFPATSATTGTALSGTSSSGIGVQGTSGSGTGVQGISTSSYGVEGSSTTAPGVLGYTAGGTLNTAGAVGQAGATSGFSGIAGVWGDSSTHVGVFGSSSQAAGVLGQSTTGVGVQGSSTSQNGVYGFSSKTSGVHGETQSTSTGDAAVYGGSDSVATGVIGISANGTGVQGVSTNSFAGRFQNSSAAAAVYATNAASSGGSALYGVASGKSGIGVYATATASNGTGVEAFADGNAVNGISNGDVLNTAGVLGVAGSRTGVGGIAGVWGDAVSHVGVIGSSTNYSGVYGASTKSYGVQAFSANGPAVYAVSGSSLNPSLPGPIGVWGDITGVVQYGVNPNGAAIVGTATNAQAGYFANNSDAPTVEVFSYGGGYGVYQGDVAFRTLEASSPNGTCGFGGNGDLTCTGQVKALATTANGARTVETYSMQSPENWMEDFGAATLRNGAATVTLDPAFAQTVSADADYHVFLTPRGDSKGLYVTHATPASFEVHESGAGTSTIAFDYRIVAKRRGYETQRMTDVTAAIKAVRANNDLRAQQLKKTEK